MGKPTGAHSLFKTCERNLPLNVFLHLKRSDGEWFGTAGEEWIMNVTNQDV